MRTILFWLRALALAAGAGLAAMPGGLLAQDYPSRPVRLVVPFPPGGSADILARVLEQALGARLGQSIVVEHKPGAGTAIGATFVARSAPDGYTLLLGTVSSHAMNPALTAVAYDPVRDFVPIVALASIPFVLDVHPAVRARTVQELVVDAKARPGQLNYSSAGNGTSNHLAGALFVQMTGADLTHVPYKGSAPALQDLVAGRVQVMFDLVSTSLPVIAAGSVRPLAVTSATRVSALPEVPTVKESGYPQYEVTAWFGLFAPAGTPEAIVARLHREMVQVLAAPDVRERLAKLGMEPMPGTQQEFAKMVAADALKWRGVVKDAGIKAE